MNEVKTPKKPLIFYYGIAMVVLLLLNMLVMPLITQHQVEEVDYGTFIKMTENKEIGARRAPAPWCGSWTGPCRFYKDHEWIS